MMGDKEMDAVDAVRVAIKQVIPRWDEDVLLDLAEAAVGGFLYMYKEPIAIARWARKNGFTHDDLAELVKLNVDQRPGRMTEKQATAVDVAELKAATEKIGETLQRMAERHDVDYDEPTHLVSEDDAWWEDC